MKKLSLIAILAAGLMSCSKTSEPKPELAANYEVVPLPVSIVPAEGNGFTLRESTKIAYPEGNQALKRNAELLADYLKQLSGLELNLTTVTPAEDAIVLTDTLTNDNAEAYNLTVTDKLISINGASPAGNFYGIQTLRKSVDASQECVPVFPAVTIEDAPRFSYRGAMFDTSRHFFTVDEVKKFIDMIALHNINRLHWHLTDDQGWRIEIKKHPKLTEIGSRRDGTCILKDFESSDSIPYGGFFTQEEARDIVNYAADRHITVIPEIDLPGHMLAALTSYPELGCTGGPYKVWQRWGVSEDILCAGNDTTLAFIDDVLNEIVDIFPSEYIHIGGDECPKERWQECPKCQQRIKELGLKSDSHSTAEQKLQSFVMEHAAKTLASRGRKMIGWDEIIEGGLFPGATVMSWRGVEGAREAAKQGHDAIMTPTNYCYFDYLQSQDVDAEPFGIGGFVPVPKVYSFDPTETLTPEQAKHILGAQANLWTEYIADFDHVQYMELPRLAALSEVQWVQPDKKDYDEFTTRLVRLIDHYKSLGYNYAKHVYDIQGGLKNDPEARAIVADLRTIDNAPIHYTLDGTTPTADSPLYTEPVKITSTAAFKAVAIRPEGNSHVFADSVTFNKATSSDVKLLTAPHSRYSAPGSLLTDGRLGKMSFNTGEWMGFEGSPLVAVIDLGSEQEFSQVGVRTLVDSDNWIFDVRGIKVEVSADGKTYTTVADESYPALPGYTSEIRNHTVDLPAPVKGRYVKVTALTEKSIPAWHGGKGNPGFLFVDEISIN